uniref:Pentacotripeptide-repeat region of PRORP domain-containing protein n=1 Tax=Setaria italica TaxID=4555 RepID=K4AKH6_SETIT
MKQSLVASLEHTIGDRSRSRSLGPDDALRLFDELIRQQRSRPGSVIAYNHLLAAAARGSNNGAARAVSLFGRMAGAGAAVPDACTYSILIASCCRAGRVDLAFSPLATALKADLRMTPKSFTPLLRGLCGERRVAVRAEAVDVARRMMPELGCAPNAFSHSAILKGLCDDGRSLEALELLRTLAQNGDETGVVSYTIVIDGLFKKTSCKGQGVLQWMVDEGVAPNCAVYDCLIRGYGTAGQWKRAVTMFKEMVGKGIKPHVSNYNSLIGALCKHRRSSEARKFLDYMLKSGEKPDVNTYGILLHGTLALVQFTMETNALCKTGRMEDAMSQFNQMIHEGVRPDCMAYTFLVEGFCTSRHFILVIRNLCSEGRLEEAHNLFNLFVSVGGKPDIVMYGTLINWYCLSRKMEKAMKLFNAFVSSGFKPDNIIYSDLINGFCKKMLSKEIKPTVISYGIILDGLFKAGRTTAAMEHYPKMIDRGVKLDIVIYNTILGGLCKNNFGDEALRLMVMDLIEDGLLEEADDMFLSMEKSGCAPDSRMLNCIVRILSEKGQVLKAGTYLSKIDEKNFPIYASTTQALISLFSDGKHEEHKKLLPEKYQYFSKD